MLASSLNTFIQILELVKYYLYKKSFTVNNILLKENMLLINLFPYLNAELPERSYGADCRLYVPENPKNKFINIYV
jgi:hypothetical protein